ncbi:HAD family hydrolase [Paenibacillus macquariensis]|uniref:Haloacid dehalogenase superfamily, subfamily IA, variant 1 with third motif having Dx(3-4)D or Dx(3-4)E n=1 Tax=Paenibacillus macquariensis TaxID=948756 RepID=A0ABY1JP84_9BACL|nr:HAD family hydrolase [Paenibacillus macquariensis]MEC0091997.1 HAD family hydrolase [Paenibacillus macquariensis]OAB37432.1 HAD family hydrolase [Paenibacillus macquariensis subsp. macquariensis]SIQ53035.1 haloacid dehalogenase superfamily, subfamily IA, variant 1 with third motif having Dx(3-4)D or Dx(3-4)E [Paenibacillus macquariensis]
MYNTIIFDVDGTLIDTERAVLGSLQKMLKIDYDFHYESHELYFVLGIPGVYSLKELGVRDIAKAHARWEHFMKDFYHTIEVFGGITELLVTLKQRNINQGIVTSKTSQELQDDFVPFGLMDNLTHVVCADDTLKHKPNPDPLLKYLEISGADPKSSIYIGDTIYDYECARDAGVDFGLALWGCKNHESIPAKYKLEQPIDVITLLSN